VLLLLFEVTPRDGHLEEYLETAARLRPALDAMGGCLFIDRYRSLENPRQLLSFQVWRDEAALTRWRVHPEHHKAQALGRARVFEAYRLRVVAVTREESLESPAWHASQGSSWHAPGTVVPRTIGVAESMDAHLAGAQQSFESLYRPGAHAHLLEWATGTEAPTLAVLAGARRLRIGEIERDYGMIERSEAPQYFAPIGARQ
jgi:heme-degrading monooxygenase HmoA